MANNGSPKPVFETNSDNVYFLTTLPIHAQFKIDDNNLRPESKAQSGAHLEAQSKLILHALAEKPLSAGELVNFLELKTKTGAFKRTVKELLDKELLDKEFIEYTLPDTPASRLQKYRLTASGIKLNDDL